MKVTLILITTFAFIGCASKPMPCKPCKNVVCETK